MLTFGTHNTLDGKAPGTNFAKVLLFTEAIGDKIRRELGDEYHIYVCKWQKDLVIALHKSLKTSNVKEHYRFVHPGVPTVTPHRGTYWLTFELDEEPYAVLVEHRINAAFPPFRRGEKWFRQRMWRRHTRISIRIVKRLLRRGRTVVAGGDLNTPRGVKGYQSALHEVGFHFDRLAASFRLTGVRVLSKVGSDHNRLRAEKRTK